MMYCTFFFLSLSTGIRKLLLLADLCKYSNQIPKVIRFCLAEDKLGCFAPAGGNDRPLGGSYENNASKSHYGPWCFLILNLAQKRKKKFSILLGISLWHTLSENSI